MNALLSVSDKEGLPDFARALSELGVALFATGGTERTLRDSGIPVQPLQALTGFPELLDGRVKTLHPHVHAGILARRDVPKDLEELAERGLPLIDLVVVNLYPFLETVQAGGSGSAILEAIDIGGVALLRAAAKNHAHVLPVVRPADYRRVLDEIRRPNGRSQAFRQHLAAVAFAHTAAYDAAIADHFRTSSAAPNLPAELTIGGPKLRDLRYGENPHQAAALYRTTGAPGIAGAQQWQGLELSYNNLLDAQAAWALINEFEAPAAAIIKHANPCGVALAEDVTDAYERAYACDPRAAFGGIVALNRRPAAATAERLSGTFLEVVLAPGFDGEVLATLSRRPKLRVLEPGPGAAAPELDARPIAGGLLVQTADLGPVSLGQRRVVTDRHPDDAMWADLEFAWVVVKHVRSNAIVLAKSRAAIGIGAGQMSRVEAVELAVRRADTRAHGAVMASDGFFPYPDGIEVAARAGVTAIVQPGGSVNDAEVIAAANSAGIAMVFTGERHFRH